MSDEQKKNGLAAMLQQFALRAHGILDQIKPLLDQPIIRYPYAISNRAPFQIAAGATGAVFPSSDFQHNLEWPFEVIAVKPLQDPAHTVQDWRLGIQDQVFNQPWFKTGNQLVAGLIDNNTGKWPLQFPWVVRPKGGGLTLTADNLDTVNPIEVSVTLLGYLLIPRT